MKRALVVLFGLLIVGTAAALALTWWRIERFRETPYGGAEEKVVVGPLRDLVLDLFLAGAPVLEHVGVRPDAR